MTRPGVFRMPRTILKSGPLHSIWVGSSAQRSTGGEGKLNVMLKPFSSETEISPRVKKEKSSRLGKDKNRKKKHIL